MRSAVAWEQYAYAREQLQQRIADKIRRQISSLVGSMDSADVLLVAADGKKLPAHECILRARAPGFYQRHVEATIAAMGPKQEGKLREVAIGDIDSAGLEFFIHSVYTEEEMAQFPADEMDDQLCEHCRKSTRRVRLKFLPVLSGPLSQSSNRSYNMEESTELDFVEGEAADRQFEEQTPIAGPPPLPVYGHLQSGYSAQSSPRRQPPSPYSQMSSSLTSSGHNPQLFSYSSMGSSLQSNDRIASVPVMTSFRDLATGSPMNSSVYSLGGRSEVADIPEEEEEPQAERRSSRHEIGMSKFIRLDSVEPLVDPVKDYMEKKRNSGGPKQIFPMFIGLSDVEGRGVPPMENDRKGSTDTLRSGRIPMSKRLSMTSLTSLTSIDVTPGQDAQAPVFDRAPASKLAADLLQMYLNNEDTDVLIRTENGDLHAHKCILMATCPFFRQQLQKSKKIELKGYSRVSVHFLLSFLYGGLTTIPEEVDVWEVISLATHLNHKDLVDVVQLHLKASRCHWFHRPCAGCVSSIFDALPQLASIRALRPLYEEALAWQAKHFSRIWKGRVFIHLNERWQKESYEAVIQQMDDETVIDTILGCERLHASLPRSKSESAVVVLSLVDDVLDVAMQFLVHSFHLVVTSNSFRQQGKGLALNLGILEDLLPSVIHSLSADVTIKTYKGLGELMVEVQNVSPSPKRTLSIPIDEYSVRFASLVRRMYEIVNKHLLHYAASMVKADAWHMLTPQEQQRIHDTGLFVELRQPKAPPPRLSSLNKNYKRSASVGVQFSQSHDAVRSRSIERGRPLSTIQQTVPLAESETRVETTLEPPEKTAINESPRRSRKDQLESLVPPKTTPSPKPPSEAKASSVSKIAKPSSRTTSKERVEEKREQPAAEKEEKKKENKPEPPPPAATPLPAKMKSSEESQEPKKSSHENLSKKPLPMKKRVIETEEGRLERQGTHTIMTLVDKSKNTLPGPEQSPTKVLEKPKSVVKPMVKDPPLAVTTAAVQRPTSRSIPKAAAPVKEKSSLPTPVRSSAIPKTVASRPPAVPSSSRPRSGPTTRSKRPPTLDN